MEDLARWISAQLDADERIARAVEDRSAPFDGQWIADGDSAVRTLNGHMLFYRHGSGPLKPGLADHVAQWDPARVLRDIDAKRKMIAAFTRRYEASKASSTSMSVGADWVVLADVLRLLAAPYLDRPGYEEAAASLLR